MKVEYASHAVCFLICAGRRFRADCLGNLYLRRVGWVPASRWQPAHSSKSNWRDFAGSSGLVAAGEERDNDCDGDRVHDYSDAGVEHLPRLWFSKERR